LEENCSATGGVSGIYYLREQPELLEIVKKLPRSIESLKMVDGFGSKKSEKYGRSIVDLINKFYEQAK